MNREEIEKRLAEIKSIVEPLQKEQKDLEKKLFELRTIENSARVHELVDKIFALDPDATIIPLDMMRGEYDGGRGVYIHSNDRFFEELTYETIYRDDFITQGHYNDWAQAVKPRRMNDDLYKELWSLIGEDYAFTKDDDNDSINECWYEIVAVKKDYSVVCFVCRGDGMMLNEYRTNGGDIIGKL